jgi:hypothetical protein
MRSCEVTTRPVGMWEVSLTLNSNGADSHYCHYAYATWYTSYLCHLTWRDDSVFPALQYTLALKRKKYHCGGDSWWGSLFMKQLKKWVKPVFLLSCYGCISTKLGIRLSFVKISEFRGGGGWTPETPTSVHHCSCNIWVNIVINSDVHQKMSHAVR